MTGPGRFAPPPGVLATLQAQGYGVAARQSTDGRWSVTYQANGPAAEWKRIREALERLAREQGER